VNRHVPSNAIRLGPSSRLPAGQAALYRDPQDGQADIVVRDASGGLTAMSAVCTHAGCDVEYQQGTLYCPCHGSVFNARTGAVEQGPAPTPLPLKHVVESGGSIYAVPS
jgi:thiosulfate dehydrogenase [quinone] large subunit